RSRVGSKGNRRGRACRRAPRGNPRAPPGCACERARTRSRWGQSLDRTPWPGSSTPRPRSITAKLARARGPAEFGDISTATLSPDLQRHPIMETAQTPLRGTALTRHWWAYVLRGVLAIIFGALAFTLPRLTFGALMIGFAAYAFADGVLAIVGAMR